MKNSSFTSVGIIPSRMNSSRFPGKPLKLINGLEMVKHCYLRTKLCAELSEVYVATCDDAIKNSIESIGGKVIMTSPHHQRATTRTCEANKILNDKFKLRFDNVIMVQGDEPLIIPDDVSKLINSLKEEEVLISNLVTKFLNAKEFIDQNNIKVVSDMNNNALYFSRSPIPSSWKRFEPKIALMQSGIIGFKSDVLEKFINLDPTPLEEIESIDMNRALENNIRVKLIETTSKLLGVDTKDDLLKAERMMSDQNYTKYY